MHYAIAVILLTDYLNKKILRSLYLGLS